MNAFGFVILNFVFVCSFAFAKGSDSLDDGSKGEAPGHTEAASVDEIGCSHCIKDSMSRMATHMSAANAAKVAEDLTTDGKATPSLGDSSAEH